MKDSRTRLMDLFAGWADFVSAEEDPEYVEPNINQKIYDLYQEAGQIISDQVSDEQLADFCKKIVAIIKGGELVEQKSLSVRHAEEIELYRDALQSLYDAHCHPGCSHEGEGREYDDEYRAALKKIHKVFGTKPPVAK